LSEGGLSVPGSLELEGIKVSDGRVDIIKIRLPVAIESRKPHCCRNLRSRQNLVTHFEKAEKPSAFGND
jgi:hypothetical protein